MKKEQEKIPVISLQRRRRRRRRQILVLDDLGDKEERRVRPT